MTTSKKAVDDNRSRQLNHRDSTWYSSRGLPVPDDLGSAEAEAAAPAASPRKPGDTAGGKEG